MEPEALDSTDRAILHLLQQDARNYTNADIADDVGVSATTVRNRIRDMEESGIINGYAPNIDYDEAGFDLHVLYQCETPDETEDAAEAVIEMDGVVHVRKMLTGRLDLLVEAVGTGVDDVERITRELEEMDVDIADSNIASQEFWQPFDHFGAEYVEESGDTTRPD
ncbi:Lrp/AsnC family transcriptional regulator [Halobium salinum]|uniref:Lrp/AsnC family transcriptional regulator n=1 Tax=Halobium salinum TaxID=1364940 RepID=A0ABD5P656_9EURY|nr:Lrp/AsnC family transcriptional regulator [Halobium salinum]